MSGMQLSHALPLRGTTTLIAGHGLAASLLARLLAEQGAHVVRRGGYSFTRSASGSERTERSDRRAQSAERFCSEGMLSDERPAKVIFEIGVPRPMGMNLVRGPGEARDHPLVHVVLPDFPVDRNGPATEGEIGAAIGLFTDIDLARGFLGLGPVYSALPYASVYGAVHAALAATLALAAARRDGRPRRIEVSLAAAGMSAMGASVLNAPGQPPRYDMPRLPRALQPLLDALRWVLSRAPERVQRAAAHAARAFVPPFMDAYPCRDGRLLYIFAVDHDRAPRRLLEATGLWDGLARKGLGDIDAYGSGAVGDNVRESTSLSRSWNRRVRRGLARRLRARPAEDWEQSLNAAGVCCTVVRGTADWMQRPELAAAGVVEREPDSPCGGPLRPGPHVWVSAGPPAAPAATPAGKPAAAPAGSGLLGGFRVLDLSTMVAGPTAARTLGEYGAEVVKVASPRPHHGPRLTCWYGLDVDRGKRSALIDLRSDAGSAALRRLIARADVVVHNFTDDAAARLGVTADAVAAARPDAVICRVGAFRGPSEGPWGARRGYDPVLQAASGIMVRFGTADAPAHHGVASCIDYLTGYSAAFAAALALLARQEAHAPRLRMADTALVQSALLIQASFAEGLADTTPDTEGPEAVGPHALERLYRARGGWLWLSAPPERLSAVVARLGVQIAEGAAVDQPETGTAIARALRRMTPSSVAMRLHEVARIQPIESIAACRSRWLSPLRPGHAVETGPFAQVVRATHPGLGPVETLAPGYARIEGDPLRVPAPARKPGADTRAVLAEAGFAASQIDAMIASGAAAEQLAECWLPP